MSDDENLAFDCEMPWARINHKWYVLKPEIGWVRASNETIPDESYWVKLTFQQWAACRKSFVENGLMAEAEADHIASKLTDAPVDRHVGEDKVESPGKEV